MLSSNPNRKISLAFSGHHSSPTGPQTPLRAKLAARSRVTNLGIVLLIAFCGFSSLINLRYMLGGGGMGDGNYVTSPIRDWKAVRALTPERLKENIPDPIDGMEKLGHLVVVAGHAVWAGKSFDDKHLDENWILEDYQRGGSVKTYWKHIERGVQIANQDPEALLIFSGGQTRQQSLQTEAGSYFALAIASGMDIPVIPGYDFTSHSTKVGGKPKATSTPSATTSTKSFNTNTAIATHFNSLPPGHVSSPSNAGLGTGPSHLALQGLRMTTESFALDSYENFLFSMARFREYTGRWPERITIVGYGMKEARFEELHAKAIRWPTKGYVGKEKRFRYVGIDDEGDVAMEYEGEKIKGYRIFEKDMYGCHGSLLAKRRERNPTRRYHSYYTSAPELADLLDWCPPDGSGLQGVYPMSLPWDPRVSPGGGLGRGAKKLKEEGMGMKQGVIPDTRWLEFHREEH